MHIQFKMKLKKKKTNKKINIGKCSTIELKRCKFKQQGTFHI